MMAPMKGWVKRLALCLPIAFVVSAGVGADRLPIARVWVTPKPIGVVTSCIIKALDIDRRSYSRLSPSVKHVAKTIEPNSVIEIRPIDKDAVVDVNYRVRLEKIHDVITRVALYTPYTGVNDDTVKTSDIESKKKRTISPGRDIARAITRCSPAPGD